MYVLCLLCAWSLVQVGVLKLQIEERDRLLAKVVRVLKAYRRRVERYENVTLKVEEWGDIVYVCSRLHVHVHSTSCTQCSSRRGLLVTVTTWACRWAV